MLYREQDAQRGNPLRALLRIIEGQVELLDRDIAQLWDDFFIETCRPWVIPYIGDLVGNRLLFDPGRVAKGSAEALFPDLTGPDLKPAIAIRTRADVAKTIYYRRRKSTLPMLEELTRDVTGWPAHAVEFFELLGWNQHLEHIRPQSAWVDVRGVERMDRIDGAFDEATHTVDVRKIRHDEGWHNIRNIGLFLFRLGAYELDFVPARRASAPWRYHFSPLGNPAPLFTRTRREGDAAGLATELHVPAPLRRALFYDDLQRYRRRAPVRPDFTELYGQSAVTSFFIVRNGVLVLPTANPNAPPEVFVPELVCARLDPWPATQPVGQIVAVDPQCGRIAVGDGWPDATDQLDVSYHYGAPADLGGGPYERHKWLVRPELGQVQLFVQEDATPTADTFTSVTDALVDWVARGRPDTLITIRDSRSYALPAQLELTNDGSLVIEAASGARPLLSTTVGGLAIATLPPLDPADPSREAALTLSGVIIEGHLHVTGDLAQLRLLHATLIPGRRLTEEGAPETTQPSLVVDAGPAGAELNTELRIYLAFSIAGPLSVPQHAREVWLLDSILDGFAPGDLSYHDGAGEAGPDLHIERSTMLGSVVARSLQMSESIATGRIVTVRTQDGCVRFSYVVPGSLTPRRYRCQPDLAIDAALELAERRDPSLTALERQRIQSFVEASIVPSFVSVRYGLAPYAQLRLLAPKEIQTGAEDGSEMGAYSHLKQAQRLDNLRLRLEEYLPFGLDAGAIVIT